MLLTFGNPFQKKNSGFCAARRSLFVRASRNQKLPDFSNASEGGFKHVLSRMTAKSTILGSRSRTSCLRARFRCVDAARPSPCRAAKITLIQLLCQSKKKSPNVSSSLVQARSSPFLPKTFVLQLLVRKTPSKIKNQTFQRDQFYRYILQHPFMTS